MNFHIFGIEIERKTDILAAAAFVLAILAVLWQIWAFAQGAKVNVFPTDQLLIMNSEVLKKNYLTGGPYVLFAATMSYVNQGQAGYNATIKREHLRFTLAGQTHQHRWYQFISSDVDDSTLAVTKISDARPFPVNAGSSNSQETLFQPWQKDCPPGDRSCDPRWNYVKWDDFLQNIWKQKKLEVVLEAEVYGNKRITARCTALLPEGHIRLLEEKGWLAPICR